MEPIWRTCQARHKFKLKGTVAKIVILGELLKVQALDTTNMDNKLKLVWTVRHTKGRPKVYQTILDIQAFSRSMQLLRQVQYQTLQLSNPTHSNQQLKSHLSKPTSQQWLIKQITAIILQKFLECNAGVSLSMISKLLIQNFNIMSTSNQAKVIYKETM